MYLAERLRQFRESKKLSQGDIEKRTGLLRCYISRVENGHTAPALETLEKIARALEIPLYQLFYDGESPSGVAAPDREKNPDWASQGKGHRMFTKFRYALSRMSGHDRALLLSFAAQVVHRSGRKRS
jgi:transcriptional regulator with XRE-family HTH domain